MGADDSISILKILVFMGECGIRFKKSEVDDAVEYVTKMLNDERILHLEDDKGTICYILFSICNDYKDHYEKKTWEYLPHNPKGSKAYIEKLVAKRWTPSIRRLISNGITDKYPSATVARWHRYGKVGDREVNTKRRDYVRD